MDDRNRGRPIRHLIEWTKLYLQRIDWIYQLVMRVKSRRVPSLLVKKNFTKMVIEAYPRSANSFGARLFRQANPQYSYEEVSHHSHIVSNVKQAVRWKIPVLVIVREPVDTITSNMMAVGDTSDGMLRILAQKYVDFYQWILDNHDKVVVVRFETIASGRFAAVSRILNERFDTDFNVDFDEESLADEVRAIIKNHSPHKSNPTRVALPTAERESAYDKLRPRVRKHKAIAVATTLYERLLAETVSPIEYDRAP